MSGPRTVNELPQDIPISVARLTRAMGESGRAGRQRVRRWLQRHHQAAPDDDPILLQNPGGRGYMVVSINRLRRAVPGFGERSMTVEEMAEKLQECMDRESAAHERTREMKKDIQSVRARLREAEASHAIVLDRMHEMEGIVAGAIKAFRDQSLEWFKRIDSKGVVATATHNVADEDSSSAHVVKEKNDTSFKSR